MPEVVLDEEVHVQAGHVQQLAHQALCQWLPVSEFVGDIDAVGCEQDAAGQGESNQLIGLVTAHLHGSEAKRQQPEDDGHIEVEHRIENPLGLLVRSVVGFEVVRLLSRDHVEEGDDQEGVEHCGVGPDAL